MVFVFASPSVQPNWKHAATVQHSTLFTHMYWKYTNTYILFSVISSILPNTNETNSITKCCRDTIFDDNHCIVCKAQYLYSCGNEWHHKAKNIKLNKQLKYTADEIISLKKIKHEFFYRNMDFPWMTLWHFWLMIQMIHYIVFFINIFNSIG